MMMEFIIVFILILFIIIVFSFRDKGKIGENKVSRALYANLDKEYVILNDVIIPDNVGGATQIDHIVLS